MSRAFVVLHLCFDMGLKLIGNEYSKDRKDHHAGRGQYDRQNFAQRGNGKYIGPNRRHIHEGPPDGGFVIDHGRVDAPFQLEEDQG